MERRASQVPEAAPPRPSGSIETTGAGHGSVLLQLAALLLLLLLPAQFVKTEEEDVRHPSILSSPESI